LIFGAETVTGRSIHGIVVDVVVVVGGGLTAAAILSAIIVGRGHMRHRYLLAHHHRSIAK